MPRMTHAILALAVIAAPLAAQDQDYFGAAVAFRGPELFVVKRAPARGPAGVMVYTRSADGWSRTQVLHAPGAVERGLALSSSVAVGNGLVLVGGGDPYGHWGAHAWESGPDGWVDHVGIALAPEPEGPPTVSLSTVMQILRPLPRAVSARGEFVVSATATRRGSFTTAARCGTRSRSRWPRVQGWGPRWRWAIRRSSSGRRSTPTAPVRCRSWAGVRAVGPR